MTGKSIFLRLFFAVFLFLCVSYGDTNVLENPGFESGDTSGWTARGCSIEVVTSPVNSESYSARVYNRTSNWHGIQQDLMGKIVEGQAYEISGYIMLENAASANVQCTVQQTVDGSTTYNWVDSAVANDSNWVRLSGTFIPNDGGGTLTQLLVYFEGDVNVDFYVDDAVVYGPEPGPVDPNATGQIDINTRHQEIEGFGAAGAWYENWLTAHPLRETLYDIFFDQLGLDIYRLRNTYDQASGGGADYMNRSGQIIAEAKERNPNLKILISSWSPPAYLKSNGDTAGGGNATLDGGPSAYVYSDFADWWADSITAWSGYGVDADYISIQNEPDYDASWDSCRLDPTENSSIAGYNEAFEAVYSELNSRFGSSMPKMLGPEATGFYGASGYNLNAYLTAITNPSHYHGYAHHLYNINAGDNPDAYIGAMQNLNSSWGSKPLFQTEYEKSTNYWPDAYNMALLLHNSLVEEEVSGYIYWDLFWGGSGGLVTIPSYGGDTYIINSDYYGFKHYSAFIHSGWQRIDAETDSDALRISAYISPDNNQLTVVVINTAVETDIELDFSFNDFVIAESNVYRSSPTENCALVGSYYGDAPLILPANSVTTLALTAAPDNTAPVAVAGPNQVVPVSGGGYATVNLDGSGSFDDDGDPLNYYWSWTIGSDNYEANSVLPTIQLPAGEHTIKLVVDDGVYESEPDYCKINVVDSLQVDLFCVPYCLNSNAPHGWLLATIPMPSGIHKADVDCTEPLIFNPGQAESKCMFVFENRHCRQPRTYVWAWFKKSECIEQLEPGVNEVNVIGKLTSGQPFNASGHLKLITPKPKKWPCWPPFGRWCGGWNRK